MSTLRFLPWVRRGASSGIAQTEDVTKTNLGARAAFTLATTVNSGNAATVDVQLYGPGDIVGFDHAQIIRTEPKPQTGDFEPNYLAAIEFDLPDFVWLMTPANPKSGASCGRGSASSSCRSPRMPGSTPPHLCRCSRSTRTPAASSRTSPSRGPGPTRRSRAS